jgi:multidrug resistance efflux pump
LDEQRNEMDYERLRLDCLRQRTELAIARVNLQQAENEFHRVTRLHAEKVESGAALEVAARDQERLRAEVAEKTRLLTEVEGSLARLAPTVMAGNPHPRPDLIRAAMEAQEAQLTLLEGPITLKAPAQGTVSFLNHRPGEKVMAGDPILTITLDRPERIVGYIRQPLRFVPKVGDTVLVRSRGPVRQMGTATVLRVGGEMQTVSAPVRLRGLDSLSLSSAGGSFTASLSPDRGLPFLLNLPEGMEVYPGELVDIIIR